MRWILKAATGALPVLFLAQLAFGIGSKNFVEKTYESQIKDKNPVSARAALMNEATEKVSEELIKEIIGESKFTRNKSVITSKIIKKSARYIPFTRPGELVPLADAGYKMAVTLRVNVDDLQAMLLENGLFYESDSTPVILPVIRFQDKLRGKTYGWWRPSSTNSSDPQGLFLTKESKNLEQVLKNAFLKHNFYLVKPQANKLGETLPTSLSNDHLRSEDLQFLSQKMGAPILLEGEVSFIKSPERSEAVQISLRMTASQVKNSRVIAEVTRQFETEVGSFEAVTSRKLKEVSESISQELSTQVYEAWQKGALGASLFRLSIQGRLPLLQQEAFKEALKTKVREVKNIRERVITSDSVVFEVDSTLGPKELAQKAPRIEMPGMNLVLESSSDTEAVYRISK